jgi:hypothetical protein
VPVKWVKCIPRRYPAAWQVIFAGLALTASFFFTIIWCATHDDNAVVPVYSISGSVLNALTVGLCSS